MSGLNEHKISVLASLFIVLVFFVMSIVGLYAIQLLGFSGFLRRFEPDVLRFSLEGDGGLDENDLACLDDVATPILLLRKYRDDGVIAIYANSAVKRDLNSVHAATGSFPQIVQEDAWYLVAGNQSDRDHSVSGANGFLMLERVKFHFSGALRKYPGFQVRPGQVVLPLVAILKQQGSIALQGNYALAGEGRAEGLRALERKYSGSSGVVLRRGDLESLPADQSYYLIVAGFFVVLLLLGSNVLGIAQLWTRALLRDIAVHRLCGASGKSVAAMIFARYASLTGASCCLGVIVFTLIFKVHVVLAPFIFFQSASMVLLVISAVGLLYFPAVMLNLSDSSLPELIRS